MKLAIKLLIPLAVLPFPTHAAQNLTASVLAWTPNMTVLSTCIKNVGKEASNTAGVEDDVIFDVALVGMVPSQYWLVRPAFGMAHIPIGSFANSDASLCTSCNGTAVAFSPDRLEPSYTPGWPELTLVTITEAVALFGAFNVPKSQLKLFLTLLLAVWHFACHTRAWVQYLMDSRTGPWLWGDTWFLILLSIAKVFGDMKEGTPPTEDGNNDINIVQQSPSRPPSTPPREVPRKWGFILNLIIGVIALGSVASGLADGVLIYLGLPNANQGRPRSRAYDLNSSIPIECVGLVPPYLPAPRYGWVNIFWMTELVVGWVLFVALLGVHLSKKKARTRLWCRRFLMFGWFFGLRPVEIIFSVLSEWPGNIVLNYGKCCVVMPSLMHGNVRDEYGLKLAVAVRALGLT